ncbi:hypothetical protein TNCV_4575401 [Trichonephila clavipes]|nr:hypothetical protein TNCV_4575401 [Trichonephila clavipes]
MTLVLTGLKSNLKPFDHLEARFKVSWACRKIVGRSLPWKQTKMSSSKATISQQARLLSLSRRSLIMIFQKIGPGTDYEGNLFQDNGLQKSNTAAFGPFCHLESQQQVKKYLSEFSFFKEIHNVRPPCIMKSTFHIKRNQD